MHRAFLLLVPAAAAFAASGCVVGNVGNTGAPYSSSQTYTGFDKVDVSAGVEHRGALLFQLDLLDTVGGQEGDLAAL